MASLEYDKEARAIYIRLRKDKVSATEPLSESVIFDLNQKGRIVGIEVLLPKTIHLQKLEPLIIRETKPRAS